MLRGVLKIIHTTDMAEKKTRLQVLLFLIFVILSTALFFLLESRNNYQQQQRLQLITERYQRAYNTIYDQYKQLAANLYSGIIERYNIPNVYQKLLTADEEQKNRLRAELLARIGLRYEELKKTGNVRQLHFHLRNNESFLRAHRPDKYGDLLTETRETVNYVNTKHTPIDGFEEGKIFCGYRFVFPVSAADQRHLGSIEISFGPCSLTSAMMKQYFVLSNFFIKESITKKKLFTDELSKNYTTSHHKGYLYDKNVLAALKEVSHKEMKDLKPKKAITDLIYTNAHSGQAMSLYDGSLDVAITTIPVINPITHEMVAFFTVRSRSDFFVNSQNHFYLVFSLCVFLLGMILITFYLQYSKRKVLEDNTKLLENQISFRTVELQQSCKQLQENEERMRTILNSIPDMILLVDLDMRIIWANTAALALNQDAIGKTCFEAFPGKPTACEGCPCCKAVETGNIESAVMYQPDSKTAGESYWEDIGIPFKDNENNITRILIIARNVTERKQAEKALLESEARFRSLINELPSVAVQGYDASRKVVFWNDASVKLYGYTTDEAIGRKLEDLIIPESMKESVIQLIHDWHENDIAIPSSELTLRHKNGSDVIVYSSHIMQVDAQRKKVMYCVDVDLTKQKHAQEAVQILMRSTTGLTGQAYFDLVVQELCRWTGVDSANIGVLTPDQRVNAIALQLDGKMIRDFTYPLVGSPCVEVINQGTRIYQENVRQLFPDDYELSELHAEGYAGVPIKNSDGKPIGILWMVSRKPLQLPPQWQNVMEIIAARTGAEIERLHADRKRQEATDQIHKMQKLDSVGVLAGGIAHDFNNILTAIQGNTELAILQIGTEDIDLISLLSNIKKATHRATKLTDQLLTFSKGGDPIKGTTSLPELITESADFVLHGSQISCQYNFPDDIWMVDVDAGQISQVIQNIVLNAKDAMAEGGTIIFKCTNMYIGTSERILNMEEGNYVRITLQDMGIGIPEEIINKVFDPYFTTNDRRSGLGLAICHSIISKHNGIITVESIPDKGTLITIYLPARSSTKIPVAKQQPSKPTAKTARIMVMDDEEMIRDMARKQLTTLGHETVLVADGEQAINKYRELLDAGTPVDLVIMDLTIPGGMGGKEATQKLLQIDPNAKIIIVSGYSNDPLMANYRQYGLCAAVTKPFDLDKLQKAIETALA